MAELAQVVALGLLIGGVYALLASGLTLIFGVMDIINLAHGAFLILAAFVTYSLWTALGLDPLLSVLVTTPTMFAFGWLLYHVAIERIRGAPVLTSLVLTFALALMVEGVMGVVWGNAAHSVRPGYFDQSFALGSVILPQAHVYGSLMAIALVFGLYLLLTRTWLGRAIRASAINPQGAQLVGINVTAVAALTFALGVALTGAGGSIVSVLFPFLPGSHYVWIARLLAIVVLGGLGSLSGAVLGALLLGVAESMTSAYVGAEWATATPYLVIVAVLLARPQGLLGVRLREDVA